MADTIDYESLLDLCPDPDDKSDTDLDDVVVNQFDLCECGGKMHSNLNNMLQCSSCPAMKPQFNDEVVGFGLATSQYNSGTLSYCKITGRYGASAYQRNMYPTTTPEERRRKMVEHAMRKLKSFNSSEHHNIRYPVDFRIEAANMMANIQINHDHTLKDTVYSSTLVTCLSIVCKKRKIGRAHV